MDSELLSFLKIKYANLRVLHDTEYTFMINSSSSVITMLDLLYRVDRRPDDPTVMFLLT